MYRERLVGVYLDGDLLERREQWDNVSGNIQIIISQRRQPETARIRIRSPLSAPSGHEKRLGGAGHCLMRLEHMDGRPGTEEWGSGK